MAVLTHDQQVSVLACVPRIPACLSILGSSLLIYSSLGEKNKASRPTYHRILRSLSTVDILSSTWFALGSLVVPEGWALPGLSSYGTAATCSAQGFFTIFGMLSVGTYNSCLMLYYVLLVRYNLNENMIAKRVEPYFHFASISFPLAACVVFASLKVFNPLLVLLDVKSGYFGAWYCTTTALCFTSYGKACEGVDTAYRCIIMLTSSYILINVLLLGFIAILYWTVRQKASASRKFVFRKGEHKSTSTKSSSTSSFDNMLRKTSRRALLYAVVFFNTFVWMAIWQLSVVLWKPVSVKIFQNFTMAVLVHTFYPLQGFFNFFIYIYPHYSKVNGIYPNKSRIWSLWRAIRGARATDQERLPIKAAQQVRKREGMVLPTSNETPPIDDDDDDVAKGTKLTNNAANPRSSQVEDDTEGAKNATKREIENNKGKDQTFV